MAVKKKKLKLRPSVLGLKLGQAPNVQVDFNEIPNSDIDANTPVVLRAYVKPTSRHSGYFSLVGVFSDGTTPTVGAVTGIYSAVNTITSYAPKEKGFHVIVLTTVEDGAAHTYRTGVVKVT